MNATNGGTAIRPAVSAGYVAAALLMAALTTVAVCGGCRQGARLFLPRPDPPPPGTEITAPLPGKSLERRDPSEYEAFTNGTFPEA